MPSTYSSLLRLELMQTGEKTSTWGDITNTNLGTLLEKGIAGRATINVTAGNVTMTALNGADDEARCAVISVTGTPGVSRNVVAPSSNKVYIVTNGSNAAVVFKGAATTGVTLAQNQRSVVFWNGSDFVEIGMQLASPTFTGTTSVAVLQPSTRILNANGSAAAPSYAFTASTSTGVYSPAGSDIALSASGVPALYADSSRVVSLLAHRFTDGTAGAPSLTFSSATTVGAFLSAGDSIGFTTGGTTRFRINATGGVHVGDSATDASSSGVGLFSRARLTSGGTTQYGVFENTMMSTSATASMNGIYVSPRGADGTYTTTNVFNVRVADFTKGSAQTVTTQYGVYVDALSTGGTNRAIRSLTSAAANNWNLFLDGTAQNYIVGNVGIGSGKSAPAVALDVAGEASLTSASAATMLALENTNGGSTGVSMTSYANSASPANGDDILNWVMYGNDSGGSQIPFASLVVEAGNTGIGATQTTLTLSGRQGGATVQLFAISNGTVAFPSIGTTASAANAYIDNAASPQNRLLRSTSSLRYKTDLLDLGSADAEALITRMRPITYRSKAEADNPDKRWYGFIAEELAQIEPRLVHYGRDADGQEVPDGVQYDRITVLLVAAMQRVLKRVAAR